MRVWTCTDHDMFWPVGAASVVVAADEDQARELLKDALGKRTEGRRTLNPNVPFTLQELPMTPGALILVDGDY